MNQRQNWTSLKKSIDGFLEHMQLEKYSALVDSIYSVNIVRGRGLLCRAVMRHILKAPKLIPKFANLIFDITSKFPELGELLVSRLVILFKREYRRNSNKKVECIIRFLCELTVRTVVDDILLLQILQVLLEKVPTEDSIRLACTIISTAGEHLDKAALDIVIERMREMLQHGEVSILSQRRMLRCLRIRRDALNKQPGFSPKFSSKGETLMFDLTQQRDPQSYLNHFQVDNRFEENEVNFKQRLAPSVDKNCSVEKLPRACVIDMTDGERLQRQKAIYLTIMSSMSPDEAVHKLNKLQNTETLKQDDFLGMIVKCCASEKTYSKFFAVMCEKICRQDTGWACGFIAQFRTTYDTISRYEGSELRNIGKLFGHLIAADSLPITETLGHIVLTEKRTSSAGRVFLKFLFQEMVEELGFEELRSNIWNEIKIGNLGGLFPMIEDQNRDASHALFSINYFTAIGLGILTDNMRQALNARESAERGRKKCRDDRYRSSNSLVSESRSNSWHTLHEDSQFKTRSRSFSRSRSPAN